MSSNSVNNNLWGEISRMAGFRDIGFSANLLQAPTTPSKSAADRSQRLFGDAAMSTIKSAYQNDYCPLDKRAECERIAEPTKKFNVVDCLCKCGKKKKEISRPLERISEYTASIGKKGDVIMRAKLHDHRKCAGNCVHVWRE